MSTLLHTGLFYCRLFYFICAAGFNEGERMLLLSDVVAVMCYLHCRCLMERRSE